MRVISFKARGRRWSERENPVNVGRQSCGCINSCRPSFTWPEGDMRGVVGRYPCKVIRVQTVEFAMQMTWVAGSSESKFTGMFCIVT